MLSEQDLRPWLVVIAERSTSMLACWKILATDETAIALFSTESRALAYAAKQSGRETTVVQPDQNQLLQWLIDGYRSGIAHAVLDPDQETARSLFVLRDVLKAAKERFLK